MGNSHTATVPLAIGNTAPYPLDRSLWVSGVPRQELEALSAALRQGPLDAHFFLTLEPGFHRTALAAPMAQALVDDALCRLLPRTLPSAQRAAWRTCLMALLTLPRVAWEVECAPLRAQLTDAVAKRNSLLASMRDALYRPVGLSRREWNAALDAQRACGVRDCVVVAQQLQEVMPATQRGIARQQLLHWLPTLPEGQRERALAQAGAMAAIDGTAIDPRTALPGLFNEVDVDQRALISDAQRAAVLAALDRIAGGPAEPLLATGGGEGDRLAQRLLSVAERADLAAKRAPGVRQALADALLFAISAVPGMQALLARGWAVRGHDQSALWPSATATTTVLAPPAAAHSDCTVLPPSVASAAVPRGGRSLLALAGGLVASGLGLAVTGWHWMSAPADGEPAASGDRIEAVIDLLDTLVAVEGHGTVWQSLWQRVHAARGEDPVTLAQDVYAALLANDVAREVLTLLAEQGERMESPPVDASARRRRSPRSLPATRSAEAALQPLERSALQAASRRLVMAARQTPSPTPAHETTLYGSGDLTTLDLVRARMQTWVRSMGENATMQHARLVSAWRDLAFSEQALKFVQSDLPQLDLHLSQAVASDIRNLTGQSVDPGQIHLNTFALSQTRAEWETGQLRAPGAAFRNRHRHLPPDQRVRSELVSTHTLIGAALLPPETDALHSGLYYKAAPETYFPEQECSNLTLDQFNQAVAGRDYLAAFEARYGDLAADSAHGHVTAVRDRYIDAMSRRVSGAAVLLNAAGQLRDDAARTVFELLRAAATGNGLPVPTRNIDVHRLAATVDGHAPVLLHGVLLVCAARSVDHPDPTTLLLSPSRTPLLEAFASTGAALDQLKEEARHRLPGWVSAAQHAHWQHGALPIAQGEVIEGDFRAVLFDHELQLRLAQLGDRRPGSAAARRHAFNALERELAQLHMPVSIPVLAASGELTTRSADDLVGNDGVHWLARLPRDATRALHNTDLEDARWLHALAAGRDLLETRYPQLASFIEKRLDEEIMRRYRFAMNSRRGYIVAFNGGTPSTQTHSGWVHSAGQRLRSASFAYCAMTRAEAFSDRDAPWVGLYATPESVVFDENNELPGLQADQFLAIVRELDLQGEYLAALDEFWRTQQHELLTTARGSYLFSSWQQHAEGSLSRRGMQLALAAFGNLDRTRAQDPSIPLRPANGTRAGWLRIHGIGSTLLHIADDRGPEVLLYCAHDGHRFHEFPHDQDLKGWFEQVAATEDGRTWIESAFDLADLQDGWFSNGVHSALGGGGSAMFGSGRVSSPIEGDPSLGLVERLRERSRRDAVTLITSPWESFRHRWIDRLARFDQAAGLASVVMPALLPLVAIGSALELGLGVEQAVDGDSEQERRAGAAAAAAGLFGLALSAPLVTGRTAALAASDGTRLQPAVQVRIWEGEADPLQHVAARYAQSLTVAGPRAADNGVTHYLGKQYIQQAGGTYEVFFDRAHDTWRLRHPAGGFYHQPVRLNADGLWEPHSDVGLRGGAPNGGGRGVSADSSYRGALAAHEDRLRSRSVSSSSLDYKWGKDHWERVVVPETLGDATSVERMKELFVSGGLDPVQKGALSRVITRLDKALSAERYTVVNAAVGDAMSESGGWFISASQALLAEESASGTAGLCSGLSRIMAVALAQGEETALLNQLRRTIQRPASNVAANVREMVRDAQGAALLPGSLSAPSLISTTELARFLVNTPESSQFILSGSRHSMSCAVRVAANHQRQFLLYDPNFGLMSFDNVAWFDEWLARLFTSRHFSRLSSRAPVREAQETLAEMYGAVEAPDGAPVQFQLRQVHAARMEEQAAARGWNSLFEYVP